MHPSPSLHASRRPATMRLWLRGGVLVCGVAAGVVELLALQRQRWWARQRQTAPARPE